MQLTSDSTVGSTVLISGGSGFIGSHIVRTFPSAGYSVRAAVRSPSSADRVRQSHPEFSSQLTFAIVPDITKPHAFDNAVRGVTGVIHSASPFVYAVTDNEKELLIPAINGTTEMLRSIRDCAPEVKHVVVTSSFAAAIDFSKGLRSGYNYTEDDWNPMTYDAAKHANGQLAYGASKKLAEAAAWEFVKSSKPPTSFTLSTILPPMVYGPLLEDSPNLQHLNTSSADIYRLMNGSTDTVPRTPMPAFADVRDVATAHLRAYQDRVGGRFLVSGGDFTYQEVCDILHNEIPAIGSRLPKIRSHEEKHYIISSSKAESELGMTFRNANECFGDMGRKFIKIEQEQGTH